MFWLPHWLMSFLKSSLTLSFHYRIVFWLKLLYSSVNFLLVCWYFALSERSSVFPHLPSSYLVILLQHVVGCLPPQNPFPSSSSLLDSKFSSQAVWWDWPPLPPPNPSMRSASWLDDVSQNILFSDSSGREALREAYDPSCDPFSKWDWPWDHGVSTGSFLLDVLTDRSGTWGSHLGTTGSKEPVREWSPH